MNSAGGIWAGPRGGDLAGSPSDAAHGGPGPVAGRVGGGVGGAPLKSTALPPPPPPPPPTKPPLVAGGLISLLLGSVAGVFLGLPIGPAILYVLLRRAVRKTRERFADQLPSSLLDMAGAVRGGRSLAGAMLAITDGADEPILGEFERAIADEQLGRQLEDC